MTYTKFTHSPRGKYAASPELYARLRERIVIPSIQNKQPHHRTWNRWAAAACAIFIVTVGIACSIYGYIHWNQSADQYATTISIAPAQEGEQVLKLTFSQASLSDISKALSDTYGVDVHVSPLYPELASYHLTATFYSDEPLTYVLDVICRAASCQWSSTENEVYEIMAE